MKVRGLDCKETFWPLGKYIYKQRLTCSDIHERTRNFLTEKYPAMLILEEVYIPGEKLFLDYYLPSRILAIECQGAQHEVHSVYFHNTKAEFFAAQSRDRRKAEWCHLNGITLVYFYPKETIKEWETKLNL